ncbi:hypothetical protein ACM64Y_01825 [Novispirillum sp. DQ9]|uniref:hypothetical protein n=1 Tax=Novispirillum sp. DQ9 TaxID=3398612 RepID=UPI003C7AB34D
MTKFVRKNGKLCELIGDYAMPLNTHEFLWLALLEKFSDKENPEAHANMHLLLMATDVAQGKTVWSHTLPDLLARGRQLVEEQARDI